MSSRNDELNNFKANINLVDFVASYGFVKDVEKSSKSTICMRDASGYKILISLSANSHWQYFSVHDNTDNGTIIDFVAKMENCNLGQIRKILRNWQGCQSAVPEYHRVKSKPIKDIQRVKSYLKRFKPLIESHYLNKRGIPDQTIVCDLFNGRVLAGYKGAVIFPHFNTHGVCGYEVRSDDFTYFSETGEKSLWLSNKNPSHDKIVFLESPIEALSYYQLFPGEYCLLVSPCGNWSPSVSKTISTLIQRNKEKNFIAAFNNDKGGESQYSQLKIIFEKMGVPLSKHIPIHVGQDWNDQLNDLGKPR